MMKIILIFTIVFVMNVLAFILYVTDKYRAVMEQRRIPESILYTVAIASGAYGAGIGMLLFRHKTQHLSFLIVVPICFVIWMAILAFLCIRMGPAL